MKSFLISTTILLCLVALTIGNSLYINKVTNSLLEDAHAIEPTVDSVEHFNKLWEKHKAFVKISSSFEETNKIDEAIGILKTKAELLTPQGFYEERTLLIDYIEKIQNDEKINIDSIF